MGKEPKEGEDPWNRRQVPQLDDIEFSSDEEVEDLKNLKRMPGTIITEEKLRGTLNERTEKLNLENHYWIKDNFIDKLGRMAPNLTSLSFKGINMANEAFLQAVELMPKLQHVDISSCRTIEESGFRQLLQTAHCLYTLRAVSCRRAVTDGNCDELAKQKRIVLLDISYCSDLTDQGLLQFNPPAEGEEEAVVPVRQFQELYMNGLTKCTNVGFKAVLQTCEKSL